jgi:anti-sigma regulatory factor (Ser/Thr protein kinase)
LATANWPEAAAEDIVLAVNEAVANVIDHAYLDDAPGTVQIRCTIEPLEHADNEPSRRVQVSIIDQGAWTGASHGRSTRLPRARHGCHGGVRRGGMPAPREHRHDSRAEQPPDGPDRN